MGPERHIFEVGVYWKTEQVFWEEYESALKARKDLIRSLTGPLADQLTDWEGRLERDFWDQYVAPRRYNQSVGWIRLFVLGEQLRGELWLVEAKRYSSRMSYKKFRHCGKAFEMLMWPAESNEQMASRVRAQLIKLVRKYKSRRLAVDLEAFDNLSPHINWRGVLGLKDSEADGQS
jgi:hypothetical protein